jgi:hypothetical protein
MPEFPLGGLAGGSMDPGFRRGDGERFAAAVARFYFLIGLPGNGRDGE